MIAYIARVKGTLSYVQNIEESIVMGTPIPELALTFSNVAVAERYITGWLKTDTLEICQVAINVEILHDRVRTTSEG
jgi:hypothetical protein